MGVHLIWRRLLFCDVIWEGWKGRRLYENCDPGKGRGRGRATKELFNTCFYPIKKDLLFHFDWIKINKRDWIKRNKKEFGPIE